jgi:glycosyltransferase involved in cell wall biosynthesis
MLRERGHDVTLTLGGGGAGAPQRMLEEVIKQVDPEARFVRQLGPIPRNDLPAALAAADLFIFASSCENMPNTLIEGMASGLPIACSERGPMPEVLQDAGVYFDPEKPASIGAAIERLLTETGLRQTLATRAAERAREYSWERCARETWEFLRDTFIATQRGST